MKIKLRIWQNAFKQSAKHSNRFEQYPTCQTCLAKFKEKSEGYWGIRTFIMQIDMGVIKCTKDNNYEWNRFTQNEYECFLGTCTNQLI